MTPYPQMESIPNVLQKLVFDGALLCIKIFVFTCALAIGNGHLAPDEKF